MSSTEPPPDQALPCDGKVVLALPGGGKYMRAEDVSGVSVEEGDEEGVWEVHLGVRHQHFITFQYSTEQSARALAACVAKHMGPVVVMPADGLVSGNKE